MFEIVLNRPADREVTVEFATNDGSARGTHQLLCSTSVSLMKVVD